MITKILDESLEEQEIRRILRDNINYMKMTVISFVIGSYGMIAKYLKEGRDDQEVRGRIRHNID